MKEWIKISAAGLLISSAIVGAVLLLLVGEHQTIGAVLLGVPCTVVFGGLATQ